MNSKKFSEAMSELDNKYIDEAISYQKKKHMKFPIIAACFILLLASCGFAYVVHTYWGVGLADTIDFTDLTQPFGTYASDSELQQEQKDMIFYERSDIINNYSDIYADNSVCIKMNDSSIPSIYFSPGYMLIFTQTDENGWILSKGEEVTINFSLYKKQNIELEVGYVLNGEYFALFSALGFDFSNTISIPQDGTYYFCVTNKSSSNAVIKKGEIIKGKS